jgi:hypothetical protein
LDKAKEYLERQDAHHADFINLESPPFMVGEEVNLLPSSKICCYHSDDGNIS